MRSFHVDLGGGGQQQLPSPGDPEEVPHYNLSVFRTSLAHFMTFPTLLTLVVNCLFSAVVMWRVNVQED